MRKPAVIAEWIRMINEEASKPLTKWEEDFMINVTDTFERTGRISEAQEVCLENIYANKTS